MPTLQRLKDAASKQQYEPLNSLMSHIYELPTTLYLHADRSKIDLITHVPLTEYKTERFLYKRVDAPYYILPNGNQAMYISRNNMLVVSDESNSMAHVMSENDLLACNHLGEAHYCLQVARLS